MVEKPVKSDLLYCIRTAAQMANRGESKAALFALQQALQRFDPKGFEIDLIGRTIASFAPVDGKASIRIAILSNHSTQPIANALRVAAIREGIQVDVYEAPFGALRQEILLPDSGLYKFSPQLVLLALSAEFLEHMPGRHLDDTDVDATLTAEIDTFQALWQQIADRLGIPIIQHTIVTPAQLASGPAERTVAWSAANYIAVLNARLIAEAPTAVYWLDADTLAKLVGLYNWHDPRVMHHAKFSFAIRFLPDYANWLGATLRSVFGFTPKALILDLDNTLWGGVIGDDGIDAIRLGPESAEGEAYQAFCHYIYQLGQRGVILGICSKNDLKNVSEVFERHPHMPLSMSDFASIRCNWGDKASNLFDIAKELNLDCSALVFVDDNPAECELVRQSLPSVQVIQMDGDPALFVRKLDSYYLFHTQRFSTEDINRRQSYQANVKSQESRKHFVDIGSYLKSLEMRGTVKRAGLADLPRLAQMEMKVNQFNLSTRRLTQEKIQEMVQSKSYIVLTILLEDRFAKHGLIAYIAAKHAGNKMIVTDWVMSCRVFSRSVEQYTFAYLVSIASELGVDTISLLYTPTAKNGIMIDAFKALGLHCSGESPQDPWIYVVAKDSWPESYIQ